MALKTFREAFMPYCIKKLSSGEWVVLNREYKPLGKMIAREQHDYDSYSVPLRMSKELRHKLACLEATTQSPDDIIYLYSDVSGLKTKKNKQAYLEKIEMLMDLKVVE